MDPIRKFRIYVVAIFLALFSLTIIEIINQNIFAEFFMRIREHVSWILGITIGMVMPNILLRIRYGAFRREFTPKIDERFYMFLANTSLLVFIVSFGRGIIVLFFTEYFEYFHLITVQWLIIVYLWFKFVNGFKISWRYIVSTELILLACTSILLIWLK
ncbi:MAG: hypothetical protein V1660_02290 [archaeon]